MHPLDSPSPNLWQCRTGLFQSLSFTNISLAQDCLLFFQRHQKWILSGLSRESELHRLVLKVVSPWTGWFSRRLSLPRCRACSGTRTATHAHANSHAQEKRQSRRRTHKYTEREAERHKSIRAHDSHIYERTCIHYSYNLLRPHTHIHAHTVQYISAKPACMPSYI